MILDEYFDRKLNNLFVNSRDQNWSVEEFGQYFADFRQIVADNDEKKKLSSRRLFVESFDCQSPSNRFRHYFKHILNERVICFEEFIWLLEGQNFKDIDILIKLLRVVQESIELILIPSDVVLFGKCLTTFIQWEMEVYLTSVENVPVKKQDISKKDLEVLNLIQQTFETILQMENFRYFNSLLYIIKNDSENKELSFVPIAKKIKEKMAIFTEQTLKKLAEDFERSFKLLNADLPDVEKRINYEENPFLTRLNSQNSLHLLSTWINSEFINFNVTESVDRLLLLTKYFGLDFRTTMKVILITNVQKLTEYQEPIPEEMELSYYAYAYHRLVPFIKEFINRRDEMFIKSPINGNDEELLTSSYISSLIIETLTSRVNWLKMIINQINGLLLANFFFKLEKEKIVDSALKLRQLIDPSFLDQSEDAFFGRVLKFEHLVMDFLEKDQDSQALILNDLDFEIVLINFAISARFINKLPEVVQCLINICENERYFNLSFNVLIFIVLNQGFSILKDFQHCFIAKFILLFLSNNSEIISKRTIKKFQQSNLKHSKEEFDEIFYQKNNVNSDEFLFIVQKVTKKNLKSFIKNESYQLNSFLEAYHNLDVAYQVSAYLWTISFIQQEPFQHLSIRKFLDKLKNILQDSMIIRRMNLLSLIERKCLKILKEDDFVSLQEEKIEWSLKLMNHVKDSQTFTVQDMDLYKDILKRIGPRDFTKWIIFTLFISRHDVDNMDNAVRFAYLLFQNSIQQCSFTLIDIVSEWLLFKSHSSQAFDQTQDDLNRCIIRLMLMCVNAAMKLSNNQENSLEMEYLCNESEISTNSSSSPSLIITEFKRFLQDFVNINSSQDAIFRQTIITILFEETRNCFDRQTCHEYLPLFKNIVECLVKCSTDGITYETIISFFPLDTKEFRQHSANLLFLLNQCQNNSF